MRSLRRASFDAYHRGRGRWLLDQDRLALWGSAINPSESVIDARGNGSADTLSTNQLGHQPGRMLEPDFDPAATAVQIGRCGYLSRCRAPRCAAMRATIVLRKIDAAGRPVRQIELCDRHAQALIDRETDPRLRDIQTDAIGDNYAERNARKLAGSC